MAFNLILNSLEVVELDTVFRLAYGSGTDFALQELVPQLKCQAITSATTFSGNVEPDTARFVCHSPTGRPRLRR